MQIDMHYYGTYVLARAAGINEAAAWVIATASQFVDDSVETVKDCRFRDGTRLRQIVTAHHTLSIANTSKDDQKHVWVPFHFLPGGGESQDDPFEKRLLCGKNSLIARQMLDNAISLSVCEYGVELTGITAHVFADTFSHCGFSGISSHYNEIKNKSIKLMNYDEFPEAIRKYIGSKLQKKLSEKIKDIAAALRRFFSFTAENISRGLGHGAVVSFPDIPFLKWNFIFEDERPGYTTGEEDNSIRFLEGCELLYNYFRRFAEANPSASDNFPADSKLSFPEIRDDILSILTHPGNKEERIGKWQEFYKGNSKINASGKAIPDYEINEWTGNLEEICGSGNINDVNINLRHFYQGAEYHRDYVLKTLLPANGIHVI